MENFVINLFIPYSQDGSSAAIIAYMYAYDHQGTVSIVRCCDNEEANQKIQELLHHITIADGYNAPQPEHREIWIVGFQLKDMIHDELIWFQGHKQGRSFLHFFRASEIMYEHMLPNGWSPYRSLLCYIRSTPFSNSNYSILRRMLDPDDYEHLIAYLLRKNPIAQDVTQEDYVLNMFIEHERKKK